ncbi:hypothetical protein FRAHR75_1000003 [Frankia sp. Hr75.2]|nr:hypothetical protein FRAHR75_1000003 [Frankia sp. Hr75.2]
MPRPPRPASVAARVPSRPIGALWPVLGAEVGRCRPPLWEAAAGTGMSGWPEHHLIVHRRWTDKRGISGLARAPQLRYACGQPHYGGSH